MTFGNNDKNKRTGFRGSYSMPGVPGQQVQATPREQVVSQGGGRMASTPEEIAAWEKWNAQNQAYQAYKPANYAPTRGIEGEYQGDYAIDFAKAAPQQMMVPEYSIPDPDAAVEPDPNPRSRWGDPVRRQARMAKKRQKGRHRPSVCPHW